MFWNKLCGLDTTVEGGWSTGVSCDIFVGCDQSADCVANVGMSTVIEAGDYCGDHTCWCMASYDLRGIHDEILLL